MESELHTGIVFDGTATMIITNQDIVKSKTIDKCEPGKENYDK